MKRSAWPESAEGMEIRPWDKIYCCPTAAKPSIILPGAFLFLQDLQAIRRADERT